MSYGEQYETLLAVVRHVYKKPHDLSFDNPPYNDVRWMVDDGVCTRNCRILLYKDGLLISKSL